MRFAPRLSVAARLALTIVLVVVLSWLLGGVVIFQLMRLGVLRRGPPPGRPPEIAETAQTPGAGPLPAPEARPDRRGGGERPPPPEEGRGGGRPPRPPGAFWRGPGAAVNLVVGILLSVAAGIWLSRRFTRPLAMLAKGAGALGAGDFSHRVPVASDDEFGRVAASMNRMAKRIGDQIGALQADSRRRQQLLADVAHELRSPVATLKTMAEALRDGVASTPERTERAARTIAESAGRLERLVNDLLELARLDLDELPLYLQPVDLRAAIADALRSHSEAAAGAGIQLRPAEQGQPVLVSADPHRLAQILDNLLGNAVSHAGSGAEVSMTVEAGDSAVVTVADTGRGIAAEHVPYLFDAFYRGDSARTPGGEHSGLGLRIARGLARAHGGDLRIESTENSGTRAILTLPALREEGGHRVGGDG